MAGEDSWFPMTRALDHLRGASPDGVYRDLFFLGHIKFQYPLSNRSGWIRFDPWELSARTGSITSSTPVYWSRPALLLRFWPSR